MSQEPVKTADVAKVLVTATMGQQYGISIIEKKRFMSVQATLKLKFPLNPV